MTIFEKIVAGEIPSYKVAEDDEFLAFLDVFPLRAGHTLVIPKQATDYIFDLEDDQLARLHIFAKKVARAMDQAIECERIGVAVIGLEVPHTHIHLVPINGVADIDFSQPKMQFSQEEFIATADKIKSFM
jgi:histidine triad (HIT) family protein